MLLSHTCRKKTVNLVRWLNVLRTSHWTPPLLVQGQGVQGFCRVPSAPSQARLTEHFQRKLSGPEAWGPGAGLQSRRADPLRLLLWKISSHAWSSAPMQVDARRSGSLPAPSSGHLARLGHTRVWRLEPWASGSAWQGAGVVTPSGRPAGGGLWHRPRPSVTREWGPSPYCSFLQSPIITPAPQEGPLSRPEQTLWKCMSRFWRALLCFSFLRWEASEEEVSPSPYEGVLDVSRLEREPAPQPTQNHQCFTPSTNTATSLSILNVLLDKYIFRKVALHKLAQTVLSDTMFILRSPAASHKVAFSKLRQPQGTLQGVLARLLKGAEPAAIECVCVRVCARACTW